MSRLCCASIAKRAAASARIDGLGRLSIERALTLSRQWPHDVGSIAADFVEFLGMDTDVRARGFAEMADLPGGSRRAAIVSGYSGNSSKLRTFGVTRTRPGNIRRKPVAANSDIAQISS